MDVFSSLDNINTNATRPLDDDMVTIAEAARRLGIHRPKLSVLLKAAGIEKISLQGKDVIPFGDAVRVHDQALANGRLQPERRLVTPAQPNRQFRGATAVDQPLTDVQMRDSIDVLMDHFRTEIARLQLERDELSDRVHELESSNERLTAEIATLKAPPAIPSGVEPINLVQAVVDHTLGLIRRSRGE